MFDASRPPLLSICVPTYNRAGWLAATLPHLAPQIVASGGRAELVVSDNASHDDTARVVEALRREFGGDCVRYHRNASNIGAHPNFYLLVSELARGEFVWMLGDDDFLLPGAVQRVLDVLQGHPELDYIYVNYAGYLAETCPPGPVSVSDLRAGGVIASRDDSDRYVERVADLVSDDETCFTPMFASVFRRRPHAVAAFAGGLKDAPFSTLESVSPHAVYIVEHLLDKPCWYVGRPYVVSSSDCSWSRYHPVYKLVLLPELYDRLEARGVNARTLNVLRRRTLAGAGAEVCQMFLDRSTFGRDRFHLWRYVRRHGCFKEVFRLWRGPLGRRLRRSAPKAYRAYLGWRAAARASGRHRPSLG